MKMQRLPSWQTEWHEISFATFTRCRPFTLPGLDFYRAYYAAFVEKYDSMESLNHDWKVGKKGWSQSASQWIPKESVILDFGSGIGYLAHQLSQLRPDIRVLSFEPGVEARSFMEKHIKLKNHSVVDDLGNINWGQASSRCVLMASCDYAYSDAALVSELENLRHIVSKEGSEDSKSHGPRRLILIGIAPTDAPKSLQWGTFWCLRKWPRRFLWAMLSYSSGNQILFWGWSRSPALLMKLVEDAGFKSVECDGLHSYPGAQFFVIRADV